MLHTIDAMGPRRTVHPLRVRTLVATRTCHVAAYTLVELLIVMAIIVVLVSLLLPSLAQVRASAGAVVCSGNQRQIVQAIMAYAGDNRGMLPFSDCEGTCPAVYATSWATWIHSASCGQYLGIELSTYDTSTASGNLRVLHCPNDHETPTIYNFGVNSYGLNWQYCPSIQPATLTSQPGWYWPVGVDCPWWPGLIALRVVPHPGAAPIIADTAGEARWAVDNALPSMCQPFAAPGTLADWAQPGLWPYLQVPRHRRGTNLGFLDGHVRWSANPTIESLSLTIYTSPRLQ